MPLCTAVLAAALLSGPAAVPPDPAPPGTRAATDDNNAAPASAGRPQLAPLPGMAPQAGEFPFTLPQAPPWMAPSGMDGRRDDNAAASRSPAGASESGASGASARPGAETGRPSATAGDRADDGTAGGDTATRYVPVIDPKTRDVFIQPVFTSGKPGQAPQPFTFGPVQGVQSTRTYPLPRAEQKTAQPKTARQKTTTRPRRHQRPSDW
ncbi:hypothetical protein [Microbispora catharanthi]|uniref:Uncharacterized protein n=1 Tax=Microbispora catharanthi TaxID=1712871 RepID=A0A5N6BVC1_9ACTN|nr:hypothetical protein [Microbispora catharanthi]KAB8184444.1 hypothetical protein FH610_015115 [Microbispora catharanthi]